jgi:dolichyl-phosphate beta-glucosyltransferase
MTPTTRVGQPWLEIVVPARNEATRLPAGLAELCAKAATLPAGVAIVVVDSASTDDTAAIVRRWPRGKVPVRLVTCDRPGKGAAVRAGLLATTAPYVGFCDADMATDLVGLDAALQLLTAGQPMIIGSRSHPESEVEDRHSLIRRTGAAAFRAMASRVTPGVGDTQCGFKFFAGALARMAARDLTCTGFAFDIELIARCRLLGAEPVEVPVRWRDVGGSTFSVWRHSIAAFVEVAAIWWTVRAQPAGRAGRVRKTMSRSRRTAGSLTAAAAANGGSLTQAEAGRVTQLWQPATGTALVQEPGERAAAAG